MTLALLSAAVLLLLLPGAPAKDPNQILFSIWVRNSVTSGPYLTFTTSVPPGGILLGGMKRLQDSNPLFKFTYTEDTNYGPYLHSVNGLAGRHEDHTYWELLVMKPDDQIDHKLDVGIGCYIPSAGDVIILDFTKYPPTETCSAV